MYKKNDGWKIPALFGSVFGSGIIVGSILATKWCYDHLGFLGIVYNIRRER